MDDASSFPFVDHPLWSRFLRWCTVRPKRNERPGGDKLALHRSSTAQTEALPAYEYVPLPNPQTYIRLATLLPGKFEDEIVVSISSHPLGHPSPTRIRRRLALAEVRESLPSGWEAFQTIIEKKYMFRNTTTGSIQWEHPKPQFHTEKYEVPPRNDGVIPKYETVSYVWGNPEKSGTIRVEGPEGPSKLPVTESLVTVLRFLRYPNESRTLWIDAICLNQTDYKELSRQVPRMHEIYGLAVKGTAWLGIEDAGSRQALASLQYLSDQVVAEADTGLLFRNPDAEQDSWFDPDFQLPFSDGTWNAVRMLLQRPWFNRLWVVQEIQPNTAVQCGHDIVPLAAFADAIYCLYAKTHVPHGLRRHLEQATGSLARLPGLCFTRLLYRASTFKSCGDPRDKIYGLLGLAPKKFANSVPVMYEESNTAADVYAMACLNHASITKRLEHFHNCFADAKMTRDAPSWVPDWYSDVPGETYIPPLFATSTARAHYSCSGDKKVLQVKGLQCGVVCSLSDPLPPRLDRWEAIRRVRRWQPEDLDTAIYRPTGESMRRAYAITLICNSLKEREPDWILSSTDEWVRQEFDQALFGGAGRQEQDTSGGIRPDVSDALQCCGGRLLFCTREGYIGLGPANTRVGDVVAIFLGASTPLILRPAAQQDAPDHFFIIGECFVHGLHDATALLGPLPRPWASFATWVEGDRRCLRFLNTETNKVTEEDPRLEMSPKWERTNTLVDADDPIMFDFFRHKETGEVINWDPRLEPEELERRGNLIRSFSLL